MKHISHIICVAMLLAGSRLVHAQQAFEIKFVAARPSQTELVPLPTIGVVPVGTVPLTPDVAAQLSEAVESELAAHQDNHFEVVTRTSANAVNWAFVVRNAPRTAHDALVLPFTDQIITCLHSLEISGPLVSLHLLLLGQSLIDPTERADALAGGATMLANWRADRCATPRNDLPLFADNRANITAATRGFVTDVFDPLVFNGRGLLDLIAALTPVFFDRDGFWAVEWTPRLEAWFARAAKTRLPGAAEADRLMTGRQSYWDWMVGALIARPGTVHSFLAHTAAGCVPSVAELTAPFALAPCIAAGKLELVALRIAGQDYVAAQRRQP